MVDQYSTYTLRLHGLAKIIAFCGVFLHYRGGYPPMRRAYRRPIAYDAVQPDRAPAAARSL
jgi:hypothetical protein